MPVYQGGDLKKITGGRKRAHRKPRKREVGGFPTETLVAERDLRIVDRVYGGNTKARLRRALHANVVEPGGGQKKVKILRVVSAPMNPDFVRRRVVVKGVVIETEAGRALVVSRPGQDGVVNAVLLKQ